MIQDSVSSHCAASCSHTYSKIYQDANCFVAHGGLGKGLYLHTLHVFPKSVFTVSHWQLLEDPWEHMFRKGLILTSGANKALTY